MAASGQYSEVRVFQSFAHDGALYAYVDVPDAPEDLSISATVGGTAYPRVGSAVPVSETGISSYFLLLVDTSSSIPRFKEQITRFVTALLDAAPEGDKFLLAPFGAAFSPIGEFTEDREKIKTDLSGLTYDADRTSLYSAICQAVDCFGKRESGELHHIVVITDGVEMDKNGVTSQEVLEKLKGSSVSLHTLGLPSASSQGADAPLKVLGSFARASNGLHSVWGYDSRTAEQLAQQIPAYISGLYAVAFDISDFQSAGREYSVVLSLESGGQPLTELEYMLKIPSEPVRLFPEGAPEGSDPGLLPGPGTLSEPESSESESSEPESSEPESSEPESSEPESSEPESGTSSESGESSEAADGEASDGGALSWWVYALIGGGAVLLAAVIFLLVRLRACRKKTKPVEEDGIFMRLEVFSGSFHGKNQEFSLNKELFIGRDKSCDIVFRDKEVSAKNSRVFLADNIIYIEDLGSQNGTALSGMRIHTRNRLRSGDVISIGSVSFTLKF